jgi:hypothetical protein
MDRQTGCLTVVNTMLTLNRCPKCDRTDIHLRCRRMLKKVLECTTRTYAPWWTEGASYKRAYFLQLEIFTGCNSFVYNFAFLVRAYYSPERSSIKIVINRSNAFASLFSGSITMTLSLHTGQASCPSRKSHLEYRTLGLKVCRGFLRFVTGEIVIHSISKTVCIFF